MDYLTKLEEMLLTTILRLNDNAYGITIRDELDRVCNKKISFGALYVSLDKLVKKGYTHKTASEPTTERGGRSKNFYILSERGISSLKEARTLNSVIWGDLPELVEK